MTGLDHFRLQLRNHVMKLLQKTGCQEEVFCSSLRYVKIFLCRGTFSHIIPHLLSGMVYSPTFYVSLQSSSLQTSHPCSQKALPPNEWSLPFCQGTCTASCSQTLLWPAASAQKSVCKACWGNGTQKRLAMEVYGGDWQRREEAQANWEGSILLSKVSLLFLIVGAMKICFIRVQICTYKGTLPFLYTHVVG